MNMTGAQAVLECLKREGVDVVFGYPGGAVLTLYDELYKAQFPHILTGHEQGAVHAADGYARVTGRTGVCFATSGPGVCNMVTGIATANMDSIPLVIISGQVATPSSAATPFKKRTFPASQRHYQAQLSCKGRQRTAAGLEGGLLHCFDRPTGTGPGRHCQRCLRHVL